MARRELKSAEQARSASVQSAGCVENLRHSVPSFVLKYPSGQRHSGRRVHSRLIFRYILTEQPVC